MYRIFFTVAALLFLNTAAQAQCRHSVSYGYATTQSYSYPTQNYSAPTYVAPTKSYTWYAAGWRESRWYPAGNYWYSGGYYHREYGGIEYGLAYDPYYQPPQAQQTLLTIDDVARLKEILSTETKTTTKVSPEEIARLKALIEKLK